jgi:hypothetical protein
MMVAAGPSSFFVASRLGFGEGEEDATRENATAAASGPPSSASTRLCPCRRRRVPRGSRSGGFGGPRLRVPHGARGPRARHPGASHRGPSRSRLVVKAEAEWQERAPVDSELVAAWWLSSCWLSCRVDISTSSSGFGCRRSSSHTMPVQGVVLT